MATTPGEKAALAAAEAAKARKFERTMKSMKKAVLEVQLILLDGVDTDEQLHAAGRILSQAEYGDVVEERSIAKVCGYARCSNALSSENSRKGRYRISLSAKKVYDLEESRPFCSAPCLIASKDFGNKLPVRQDVLESGERLVEILAAVRGLQYAARSKPVRLKEESVVKPTARGRNAKRGKSLSKETIIPRPGSAGGARSVGEGGGQSETAVSSSESSAVVTGIALETGIPKEISSAGSGLKANGSSIIEQSSIAGTSSNPSSSFQSDLVVSSTSGANGKVTKSSSNGQKVRPDRDSLTSAPISSTVQTKFEKLTIQERVGHQTVLPVFDYGGPSDAIEGYVPSRSRRDATAEPRIQSKVSKNTNSSDTTGKSGLHVDKRSSSERTTTGEEARIVLRSENSTRSQQDGVRIFKDWEGLVSGSPQAGGSKSCITEVDEETSISDSAREFSSRVSAPSTSKGVRESPANLKPSLKKQSKVKQNVRSVAWADQNTIKSTSRSGKTLSKDRVSSSNVSETPHFEKSADDVIQVAEKINSLKLEEEPRPEARLSVSGVDLAMAARLTSAEAIATALTQAATSAANGELDGSEAVAQAGISILSATHNVSSATSSSPHEAQVQSGAIDEDELFARASQAREEMRRLKMPRKYSKLQDEKDRDEDGDLVDDFDPVAIEDDDDSDDDDGDAGDAALDDDDVDDDEYDDDSGGFEGAHEVGFTAPPKGFKAEVSMFGTVFMALEGWISAAAVAHIYGKEPHEEDEYLSVNGREYSRQAVIGDGVSAEILRTFSLCLSRALPEVVRFLHISVPMSTLELSLGRLIKTLSFVEALPPFGTKQWRLLAILLLDSLSVKRVPRLGDYFSNNRSMMRKVLDTTGTSEADYDVFRDVVLPLGRSPTFSTRSGG
ncbi:hypothetical protein M758_3G227100 [Ceratodon purpureus]|nr:hypothetical protein M758_3G227100 [Ceratodon purpureus]